MPQPPASQPESPRPRQGPGNRPGEGPGKRQREGPRLPWRWLVGATAVLLAALWAIAEPFWLRPLIQHHVRTHAGRQIDFDDARIRLDADAQPVLRLRHLRIENAAWAGPRPLLTASEVDITIAWRSFTGGDAVLPLLVLHDGDIDLEMQPDGLRNWRLSDPQDRGPGKVRIQSLQAVNSRLRLVHTGRDLVVELATTTLPAAERLAGRPELPLTQTLQVSGQHRGTAFAGAFAVGAVFSLYDRGLAMPLRGQLSSGGTSLALEGVVRDLLMLGGLDVSARLLSPNLAMSVGPLFGGGALPALDADARARVQREGERWAISDLQARIGQSDLAGSLKVDRPNPTGRPLISGALTTRHLHVDELRRGLAGRSDAIIAATPARPDRSRPRRLDGIDAEVDLTVKQVSGLTTDSRWSVVDGLQLHASSQTGRLTLAPLAFNIAGGVAAGRLIVDPEQQPAEVSLDLDINGLRLDRLIAPGSSTAGLQGGLNLGLKLQARGDSLPALRDSTSGTVSGALVQATLPATLTAGLALDGGQWLRALARPAKPVPVTCSVAEMRIDAGRGRSTRLAVETEDVLVTGVAELDLTRQSYQLLLTPHRKRDALLALDKSVRLSGAGKRPNVALVDRAEPAGPADCRGAAAR